MGNIISRNTAFKVKMYVLLLLCSIIPLIMAWFCINVFVFRVHERQLDIMIAGETEKTGSGIQRLMDSMKNMSQMIIEDSGIRQGLRTWMEGSRSELQHINQRLAAFEGANPTVANITFFAPAVGGGGAPAEYIKYIKINNSLARGFPEKAPLFSEQNSLKYYGPHITASVASKYAAISLFRPVPYLNQSGAYLYIESGYKLLDITPSESLKMMNAVFLAVSDTGEKVFSSDEAFLARFQNSDPSEKEYRVYTYNDTRGWSIRAYVPRAAFSRQTFNLSFGFLIIVLSVVLLSVFLSGLTWRNVQRLLEDARYMERAKSELEVKLLMFKINPHFIHNTLNTLKWYSSAHGFYEMEGFISSLNRLLAYNMEKNGGTTLQRELDSVKDYIDLQRLKYDIVYSEIIDAPDPILRSKTPHFILQPLVENAILHGLEGKGSVEVRVGLTENGAISVKVTDSGPPLESGEIERFMNAAKGSSETTVSAESTVSNGKGIGLRYVQRILESMFPGETEFSAGSGDGGTVFEIQMPFRVEDVYGKNGKNRKS